MLIIFVVDQDKSNSVVIIKWEYLWTRHVARVNNL